MKILQLVPAMEQGGVERGVVEVNRVIVGAGWENVVVSAGGRLAEKIEEDGGRHLRLDVKSKNPFTALSRARKLKKILLEEKPDAVCAHSRVPAWLFRLTNLPIPWITFAHGANSVSRYSRIMTKGDLTVTPSRFVADNLKKAYGIGEERIRVIPRAIEKAKFDPGRLDRAFIAEKRAAWKTEGRFTMMALGRITQLKGLDIAIRAMTLLPEKFILVIVGEAEQRRRNVEEDLKSLAEELGVASRIVFAGHEKNVAECLSIADVVVSANVKKPEAFGRSMAEALAMDTPVVARAFGGALDVVRDGVDGILVRPPEIGEADWPAAFASAIETVAGMEFSGLRESALERFSFGKMAESSLRAYREVVEMKKGVAE